MFFKTNTHNQRSGTEAHTSPSGQSSALSRLRHQVSTQQRIRIHTLSSAFILVPVVVLLSQTQTEQQTKPPRTAEAVALPVCWGHRHDEQSFASPSSPRIQLSSPRPPSPLLATNCTPQPAPCCVADTHKSLPPALLLVAASKSTGWLHRSTACAQHAPPQWLHASRSASPLPAHLHSAPCAAHPHTSLMDLLPDCHSVYATSLLRAPHMHASDMHLL